MHWRYRKVNTFYHELTIYYNVDRLDACVIGLPSLKVRNPRSATFTHLSTGSPTRIWFWAVISPWPRWWSYADGTDLHQIFSIFSIFSSFSFYTRVKDILKKRVFIAKAFFCNIDLKTNASWKIYHKLTILNEDRWRGRGKGTYMYFNIKIKCMNVTYW